MTHASGHVGDSTVISHIWVIVRIPYIRVDMACRQESANPSTARLLIRGTVMLLWADFTWLGSRRQLSVPEGLYSESISHGWSQFKVHRLGYAALGFLDDPRQRK
jgi:hypothetical protein